MANDIESGPLKVLGLRQASANFVALDGLIKTTIGRDALRAAGDTIAGGVRGATYRTFKRITGAIEQGLHVSVGRALKGDKLYAVVAEYPTAAAGTRKTGIRSMMARGRGSVSPLNNAPFWWRFLEFGTAERHARKAPHGKISSSRGRKSFARWMAAPSRGAVTPRPWVRPAFNATASQSIEAFSQVFAREVDKAVDAMPK